MQYLNETGVRVTNVTCDNAASNITALTLLGAKLSKLKELKVTLNLENTLQVPIFVILDTCHLMKLVRGTFHDMQQSLNRKSIIFYISGFIQRRLIRNENCVECGLLLSNLRIVKSSGLIDIKDHGGLDRPSPAV